MDISFDIFNKKGDHVLVSLSKYDDIIKSAILEDQELLKLAIFEVSLSRKRGEGMVGYQVLMQIASILGKFLRDNDYAVLSFYCDAAHEVDRHHTDIPPQQYRSMLFSRMFEMYVKKINVKNIINYPVVIEAEDPWKSQYVHFICRGEHLSIIKKVRNELLTK